MIRPTEASLIGYQRTLCDLTGTPEATVEKVAIGMSLREIANRYGACGWAVVHMAPCGEMTLRYGVGGIIVVLLKVQRTTKRADKWVLYIAVCKLSGPSEIFTDNRGVVQALNKGEVDCIMPTSRTRIHGLRSRAKLGEWIDAGVDSRMVRTCMQQ